MPTRTPVRSRSLTLADARKLALSMPEVTEATAYGMPAFKAAGKRFAGQPVPRPEVEPNTLGVYIAMDERNRLLAARPDLYYLTDHFAPYPAVLVRLSKITRDELRDLLGKAWSYAMESARPAQRSRPRRATRSST